MNCEYFCAALMEFKADDSTGIFEGYAATYNLDLQKDRIIPGAFERSLKARPTVPILRNHDMWEWVGQTVEMAEDKRGLRIKGKLFIDTTQGLDTFNLIKGVIGAGAQPGLSIGYNTVDSAMEGGTRLLKDIDLMETSITPFPAQPKATILGVKTIRDFEQHLRDVGLSKADARKAVAAAKACQLFSGGMPADTQTLTRGRLIELLHLRGPNRND